MKFIPVKVNHGWGEESIALADLGIEDSVAAEGWLAENSIGEIMETYMERVVGEAVYGYYGRQFPVSVKFLDIAGELPVHVHPDDETAEQRFDALGGKELWYIISAEKDAEIFCGFSRDISAREVYDRCTDGTIKEVMNVIHPQEGDCILIEPGILHSAGKGIRAAVIKEASELPFRLYDKDETDSEVLADHLAEAMDFINYGRHSPVVIHSGHAAEGASAGKILSCQEFNAVAVNLKEPIHSYTEQQGCYILYVCVTGEASVQVPGTDGEGKKNMENFMLKKGEAMIVPAEVQDFFVVPADRDTVLIEVTAGERDDTDDYIDPDTEPFLEGEDYEGLEDEDSDDTGTASGRAVTGKHDMNWN